MFILFKYLFIYLFLLKYMLLSVTLQFFLKKYVFIFCNFLTLSLNWVTVFFYCSMWKLNTLYYLQHIFNINLLNNYVFIHPSVLYFCLANFFFFLVITKKNHTYTYTRYLFLLILIILTNILGVLWARSEVLWSGPWSWDSIEMSLLLLLVIILLLFHFSYPQKVNIWFLYAIFNLLIRPKLYDLVSPHQFSINNFDSTPDNFKIILTIVLIFLYKRVHNQLLVKLLYIYLLIPAFITVYGLKYMSYFTTTFIYIYTINSGWLIIYLSYNFFLFQLVWVNTPLYSNAVYNMHNFILLISFCLFKFFFKKVYFIFLESFSENYCQFLNYQFLLNLKNVYTAGILKNILFYL